MTSQPDVHWLQVIGYWQTLIASILAVLAGVGAIWATIASANREVRAVQFQVMNAERLEQRRIAREGFATLALLDAALENAKADYESALTIAQRSPRNGSGYDKNASDVRRSFHMLGFVEARTRLVTHGGMLTRKFLELQREIEIFASKLADQPIAGLPVKHGLLPGLHEQLEQIGHLIDFLRQEISSDFQQVNRLLLETEEVNRVLSGADRA